MDDDTIRAELAHIGAEARHAHNQLAAIILASKDAVREAYEAGWSVDDVLTALGGPLPNLT